MTEPETTRHPANQAANVRTAYDRAAVALGLASIASIVFAPLRGELGFVAFDGVGAIVVAVVLGALGGLAGWLVRPALAVLAGAAFVVAAILQVVLIATDTTWLGGQISTSSLWLGLGVGLLAVGLARRDA
jgi:hypothetical protein